MLPILETGPCLEWDLHPITTEAQFDRILEILQTIFAARIDDRLSGPGASIVYLSINGISLKFVYSSAMGVSLTGPHAGRAILHAIRDRVAALLA